MLDHELTSHLSGITWNKEACMNLTPSPSAWFLQLADGKRFMATSGGRPIRLIMFFSFFQDDNLCWLFWTFSWHTQLAWRRLFKLLPLSSDWSSSLHYFLAAASKSPPTVFNGCCVILGRLCSSLHSAGAFTYGTIGWSQTCMLGEVQCHALGRCGGKVSWGKNIDVQFLSVPFFLGSQSCCTGSSHNIAIQIFKGGSSALWSVQISTGVQFCFTIHPWQGVLVKSKCKTRAKPTGG